MNVPKKRTCILGFIVSVTVLVRPVLYFTKQDSLVSTSKSTNEYAGLTDKIAFLPVT